MPDSKYARFHVTGSSPNLVLKKKPITENKEKLMIFGFFNGNRLTSKAAILTTWLLW